MSVEHLVVLKAWMKQKEQQKESGIYNVFDVSKFFDKESNECPEHTCKNQ